MHDLFIISSLISHVSFFDSEMTRPDTGSSSILISLHPLWKNTFKIDLVSFIEYYVMSECMVNQCSFLFVMHLYFLISFKERKSIKENISLEMIVLFIRQYTMNLFSIQLRIVVKSEWIWSSFFGCRFSFIFSQDRPHV